MILNEAQHLVHECLLNGPARKPLDQIPRRSEHPRFAEAIHDRAGIEGAAGGLKESERRFENIVGRGPADRREIGGDDAVFGGVAGMKGLRHRAEIVAKTAGLGAGDRQRIGGLLRVQAAKLCARRSAAE